MAIVEKYTRAIADTSQDVPQRIPPYFVKAKIAHARACCIANRTNLTVKTRDSDEVTQELDHIVVMLDQLLLDSDLCFKDVHKTVLLKSSSTQCAEKIN